MMGRTELSCHLQYLESFNIVQTNDAYKIEF